MALRMVRVFCRNRWLVWELVRREFSSRHGGAVRGIFWAFAQPLVLLSIYAVAFGVLLKTRWGSDGGAASYAFMVFAGLIVFNLFTECLTAAPRLITGNPNYVKKVLFPLELLPWVAALTALANALIAVLVFTAGQLLLFASLKPTLLYFPLVLAALLPVLLGTGWLFSALGVALRDLDPFVRLLSHALLFLTPVFYGLEIVPEGLRPFLFLNPLTFIVEQFRRVALLGQAPDMAGLALYLSLATAFSAAALWFFRRLRPSFADLL